MPYLYGFINHTKPMAQLTRLEKNKIKSFDPLKPMRFGDIPVRTLFYRLIDSESRKYPLRKDSKSFAQISGDLLVRLDPAEEVFVL